MSRKLIVLIFIVIISPILGLSVSTPTVTICQMSIDNTLKAGYLLNEDSGASTAIDITGSFNGTKKGNSSSGSTGKLGSCWSFLVATSDFIEIGDSDVFTNNNYTICCWIKTSATAGIIAAKYYGIGGQREWMFYLNTGYLRAVVSANGTTGVANSPSQAPVNDDAWHFIGFSKNGTTGTFYVDGKSVGVFTNYPATVFNGSTRFAIGASVSSSGASATYINANIDDLSYYSESKTDEWFYNRYYRNPKSGGGF